MVRPVKKVEVGEDGRAYECPEDYEPCNDSFFDRVEEEGHDYVICIEKTQDKAKACPITSIAFEVDAANRDEYEWVGVAEAKEADFSGLYVSKTVMAHGIEQVTVASG